MLLRVPWNPEAMSADRPSDLLAAWSVQRRNPGHLLRCPKNPKVVPMWAWMLAWVRRKESGTSAWKFVSDRVLTHDVIVSCTWLFPRMVLTLMKCPLKRSWNISWIMAIGRPTPFVLLVQEMSLKLSLELSLWWSPHLKLSWSLPLSCSAWLSCVGVRSKGVVDALSSSLSSSWGWNCNSWCSVLGESTLSWWLSITIKFRTSDRESCC